MGRTLVALGVKMSYKLKLSEDLLVRRCLFSEDLREVGRSSRAKRQCEMLVKASTLVCSGNNEAAVAGAEGGTME